MSTSIDRSIIVRRDPGLVGASLDRLADQLRDGWRQAHRVKLPRAYRNITSIALCGMGGSHLGADILRSALANDLRVPLTIIADYSLPAWVGPRTLVICSSYSGSTEETLTALRAASKRSAKIVAVTSGGKLASWAATERLPLYLYAATENPSGQPRLGVAYGMMATLACFRKLGLVKISETEIQRLPLIAWEATKRYSPRRPMKSNGAKQLAASWTKAIPLLLGAEWTAGNLQVLNNQINENAKTMAAWYLLPDLNHHLLEGLRNRNITKQLHAVIILDDRYNRRIQRRIILTTRLLKQLSAKVSTYKPHGATPLEKAIDLLAFGGYLSWYLAAARKVRPADIPTVNYLKQQLAKQ